MNQFDKTSPRSRSLRIAATSQIAVAVAALVSGCGGGGSVTAEAPLVQPADVGTISMDVTDGPASHLDQVWVTVTEVWFHLSESATAGEAKWEKFRLGTPVTIDMNSLSNGALAKAFNGITLPVGSYKQIRVFLAGPGDALTTSAKAAGLLYNDQVNLTDAKGVKQSVPLELASSAQGIKLSGDFTIAKGKTLRLAVEFNVGDDVVRFSHNGTDGFKLQPNLRYFDLDKAAAITGKVDTSACKTVATPCKDITIKLEEPSTDGTHQRVVRWTTAKPDGSFTLYPVPASTGRTYDAVITGRNTQPMIIRDVPAKPGSTPAAGAVVLSSVALPIKAASEFPVNIKPGVNPTGSRVAFYATPSAKDKPYELGFSHMNMFTGTLVRDHRLANAPLLVGSYVAGGSPAFVATAPVEGAGAYSAVFSANNFKRAAASASVMASAAVPATATTPAVAAGVNTSFVVPPVMQPLASVAQLGTVTGNVIQAKPGTWDRGFLVASHGGAVVNAIPLDSLLAANGGASGAYSIGNLPSGSKALPLSSGSYDVFARVWNSKAPDKVKVVPVKDHADLRNTSTATLNVMLP